MVRVTEEDMAKVVATILRGQPGHRATFAELREMVPDHIALTKADRAESHSRPGEEVWHQIVRNLAAHQHEGFASVPSGLRLKVIASARKRRAA